MRKSEIIIEAIYNDELQQYHIILPSGESIEIPEKEVEKEIENYDEQLYNSFCHWDDFDDKLPEWNFDHVRFQAECFTDVFQRIMENIALRKLTTI